MTKVVKGQWETFIDQDDYEENCYLCSPSISKQRSVAGKNYYVRRFFTGGNDFEKTIEGLAVQQAFQSGR